ncbi:MAG TPA: response regulator [Actinomycetota bacterium]|jgi:DNA-binding NarL/FixJ family response regulator|nr:response regulator [Actinomycetota bacterium]
MARVLLVDDDADYRLLVRLALEADARYQVVAEARNGMEAVAAADVSRPEIVLLDCSMPGTDAFDCLPELRRISPSSRVVLMSGHASADVEMAAHSAGALGFLAKDILPSQFPAELATVAGMVGAVEAVLLQASTELSSDPRSAGEARRFVAGTLEPWELGPLVDTVTLLTSELVTNAVVHAGTNVDVVVRLTGAIARVEVTDRSELSPTPRHSGLEDDSGRGLALVQALARRWGTSRQPGGGKTVWFEVPRQSEEGELSAQEWTC